ncbi:MAG: prepilin-type N-terminal cleavage/methylation domain-containing protein [Lysobacterales bacterium]
MSYRRMRIQRGFSLIELTVATAIYSMGLGSLSLMMLLALHGTGGARLDTTAALHAASLAEMIAMSSDAVGHYLNESPPVAGDCVHAAPCSTDEMAAANLGQWRARVAADLPGGNGLLCLDGTPEDGAGDDPACDGSGGPVIKVFWDAPAEQQGSELEAAGSEGRRHVSRVPLP